MLRYDYMAGPCSLRRDTSGDFMSDCPICMPFWKKHSASISNRVTEPSYTVVTEPRKRVGSTMGTIHCLDFIVSYFYYFVLFYFTAQHVEALFPDIGLNLQPLH